MQKRLSAKRMLERFKPAAPSDYLLHMDELPADKTHAAIHVRISGPNQEDHLSRSEEFLTGLVADRRHQLHCVTHEVASGKVREDVMHW